MIIRSMRTVLDCLDEFYRRKKFDTLQIHRFPKLVASKLTLFSLGTLVQRFFMSVTIVVILADLLIHSNCKLNFFQLFLMF